MKKVPVSPANKLGGIVYFARMLDKIRLHQTGVLRDDLIENLGKGFDTRCSRFLRVDYAELAARVRDGLSDEAALEWCFAHGHRPSQEEIEVWNEFMRKFGWNDSASERLVSRKAESGLADRDDIRTMFEYIDADEGR